MGSALAAIAVMAAAWVQVKLPRIEVLPQHRSTLRDGLKQLARHDFLAPTLALATSTGSLAVAVGFLPLLAGQRHYPTWAAMALVSVMAVASALTQRWAGGWNDSGLVSVRSGVVVGTVAIGAGLCVPFLTAHLAALATSALMVGAGIGIVTPLAFARLATSSQPEHLGRTMGNAEVGREIGDAAGPLLVGAIASGIGAGAALLVAGGALAASGGAQAVVLRRSPSADVENHPA